MNKQPYQSTQQIKDSYCILSIFSYLNEPQITQIQILSRRIYKHFSPRIIKEANRNGTPIICGFVLFKNDKLYRLMPSKMEWEQVNYKKENFTDVIQSYWHKVIQVNNYEVYFMSGMLSSWEASKFCYKYDIRTNLMKQLASIQIARSGFGIAYLRNRIFAIAGSNVIQHIPMNSIEFYDISKDEWQHFTPLPDIRISPTAVVFQDRFIYVIGGFNYRYDQSKLSDLIRIDLNQQVPVWQTLQIQNNVIPDACQLGALPYINPDQPNLHQLMICGGLNGILFDDIYKLEVTINEENTNEDQAQCIQLNQKLKSPDRLYFNQWLSRDQKHHSTNWILVGRESLHLFQFDKALTQVTETSIDVQNYKKLIE